MVWAGDGVHDGAIHIGVMHIVAVHHRDGRIMPEHISFPMTAIKTGTEVAVASNIQKIDKRIIQASIGSLTIAEKSVSLRTLY